MPQPDEFDVVIIGSGPGGYVAAIRAGQLGLKTAVVEKDGKFGGTCLWQGCIPTKALLHTAYMYNQLRNAREHGIVVKELSLDFEQTQKHKQKILERLGGGIAGLFRKNKVTAITGFGRLKDRNTIEVSNGNDKKEIKAKFVVLATGSSVKPLPTLPFDRKGILSSDDILELKQVPRSLLVIGAGAVGVEFASMFLQFGSKVALVEMLPQITPLEDDEIAAELQKILTRRGMQIMTSCQVSAVTPNAEGGYEVKLQTADGKEKTGKFEKVLVAVGRKANTDNLGLEKTRVQVDRGLIKVNKFMQTDEPNIYAIGDIVPTPALAHVASAEGVVAVEHLAGRHPHPINYDRIPNCTFPDPQIASIGLTEKKARERGYKVKTGKFPFLALGKSLVLGETEGFVKVISDEKYGEIVGVHILHAYASYMIGEAVAIMNGEVPADYVAQAVHPHPTLSEAMMEAAHSIYGAAIHI